MGFRCNITQGSTLFKNGSIFVTENSQIISFKKYVPSAGQELFAPLYPTLGLLTSKVRIRGMRIAAVFSPLFCQFLFLNNSSLPG